MSLVTCESLRLLRRPILVCYFLALFFMTARKQVRREWVEDMRGEEGERKGQKGRGERRQATVEGRGQSVWGVGQQERVDRENRCRNPRACDHVWALPL